MMFGVYWIEGKSLSPMQHPERSTLNTAPHEILPRYAGATQLTKTICLDYLENL